MEGTVILWTKKQKSEYHSMIEGQVCLLLLLLKSDVSYLQSDFTLGFL